MIWNVEEEERSPPQVPFSAFIGYMRGLPGYRRVTAEEFNPLCLHVDLELGCDFYKVLNGEDDSLPVSQRPRRAAVARPGLVYRRQKPKHFKG
jgi:hypothetical protein